MSQQETTREAEWAERQVALLGLTPSDLHYADALRLASAGQAAWQIAAHLCCAPEYVERLGGPRRG